jgi:hypothetical protein
MSVSCIWGSIFTEPQPEFFPNCYGRESTPVVYFFQTTGKRAPVAELVALKETRAPCPVRLDGQPKTALLLERVAFWPQ